MKLTSRFLSLVLRHRPELIGVTLDSAGWIDVDALLAACASQSRHATRSDLDAIVASNKKKRFVFSEDGLKIRASQGHSVEVDLGHANTEPPYYLFHGTADHFLQSIREHGLVKGKRHAVHLSADFETAKIVGKRHGDPIVLEIEALRMHHDGHSFQITPNGVWLTESVPWAYVRMVHVC